MTARRALVATFTLAVAALVWFLWPRHDVDEPALPASSATLPVPGPAAVSRPSTATTLPLETSELAKDLNAPAQDIRADLRIVLEVVEGFRTNFPKAGNPVGNNAEITAALTGRNTLRLALIPPNHPAINPAGELCDRWGTPFFFHAESATRMEVRSAGPDKKLWTDDDVMLAP